MRAQQSHCTRRAVHQVWFSEKVGVRFSEKVRGAGRLCRTRAGRDVSFAVC